MTKEARWKFDAHAMQAFVRHHARRRRAASMRGQMIDDAVTKKTAAAYRSCVQRMADVKRAAMGKRPRRPGDFRELRYTIDDFTLFLGAGAATGMAGSTAEGYRSALLHYQLREEFGLRHDERPWADCKAATQASKGLRYMAKDRRFQPSVRGIITERMLGELLDWCRRNGYSDFVPVIRVFWGTAGRREQVLNICSGDMSENDEQVKLVFDKTVNAKRPGSEVTWRPIDARTASWIRRAERGVPRGRFLFAEINPRELCYVIARAAEELQWPSDGVYYDGAHCLRHGGTRDRLAAVEEAMREAMQFFDTQMSRGVRYHYARSHRHRQRN